MRNCILEGRKMRAILRTLWIGLLISGIQTFADQPPVSLEQSNPVGYQKLSADDYLHFVPCPEQLSGSFVPAYSGTSQPFLRPMFESLGKIHPGVAWAKEYRFDCSAGVLEFMLQGQATIGISSWPMSSAQREDFVRRFGYPILEARVALDALQVLVHPSNPLNSITIPQLDAIYGTELRAGALALIRTWEQVSEGGWGAGVPIQAYAGVDYYGTSQFFQEAVLKGGPWRKDVNEIGVIQNPEPEMGGDPYGICFSTFRPRGDNVKVLAVARQTKERAYPPQPTHIYGEEYPLTRFFYVYANARSVDELPAESREFLNYLLSYEGQYEVAKTGSLPLDRTMLLRARKRLGLPVSAVRP